MNADAKNRALVRTIISTGNALIREAGRLFKDHGISAVQFNALTLLTEAPNGMRPTGLTEAMVVDPSSTTYVIDRMEALGWIKRREDPSDRRANLITLTTAGKRKYSEISPLYLAALREMLRGFDPGHLDSIAKILGEIQSSTPKVVDIAKRDGLTTHAGKPPKVGSES